MKIKQSLKFDYVNTGIKTSDILFLESKSTCDQVITNKDKVSDDNAYIKMNDLFKLIKKHGIDNPLVEEELLKISIEHKKLTTKVKRTKIFIVIKFNHRLDQFRLEFALIQVILNH
jgi:hypothetical protein